MNAGSPKILVVDDEPANRKLMADLVAREGYDVLTATGGAEALAILELESVDLVLLDMMMPVVDGMAVLIELQKRRELPGLPILVVTAHDDRKLRLDALAAGALDFITKPVDRLEIACRIRTLVELKRLKEQAVSAVEGQLKELNHLLQLRFFQSPVAEIAWDEQSQIVAWNPAAEALFGYSQAEVLGKDSRFLFSKGGSYPVQGEAFRLQLPTNSTAENLTKAGKVVHCEWHSAQLTSTDGKRRGIASVILDLTERTRLHFALAQSQKMEAMGQLAGGIAHDFNNILSVIMSYGAFLAHSLSEDDPRRDDANEIMSATSRAAALTKQLLAFSRQQPAEKRPVNLNESLAQLQSLLMRTLGKQVRLFVTAPSKPLVVLIDPVQFDQIALNLAVNARDAMPNGGDLRIELKEVSPTKAHDMGWAVLSVTDTGVGMDAVTQRRACEPFFTTKEVGRGTGLGLATCFGIVQEAGGQLKLHSALAQGTTAVVSLPLCREKLQNTTKDLQFGSDVRGNGELILVAEDDETLRKIVHRALLDAGYNVQLAFDGHQAIKLINELGARISLVFCDVLMPGPNGFEVAEHARTVAPMASILLTSGFLEDAARRVQKENLAILWKPTLPSDLVREVARALQRRGGNLVSEGKRTALVVASEAEQESGLVTLLTRAGYFTRWLRSWSEVEACFKMEDEVSLLIVDLSARECSADALLAHQAQLAHQRDRAADRPLKTFVLDDGQLDLNTFRALSHAGLRVLDKPLQFNHFQQQLAKLEALDEDFTGSVPPSSLRSSTYPPHSMAFSGVRLKKESVLIVEDDVVLAGACQTILSAEFHVMVAQDLAAARLILLDTDVDAVVLDVVLPDGNGFELLDVLRGRNYDIPVILTSGSLSGDLTAQALRGRITDFLPKPFNAPEIMASVRSALEGGRASRLRTKLLAARFGGDDFVTDIPATEKAFERALSQIRMVFQPIVRASNHTAFGYEALLRCDELSLSTPPRLLAAAEVLGRVDEVGRVVRTQVAAMMSQQRDNREVIFVNIHPVEVSMGALSRSDEPLRPLADRVILEITERASLEAGPKLDSELARLRDAGFRVAVDDLGEGYAGLASLIHLRPDIAKIDMSLVRNIHQAPLKRDIVGALGDMARRAGIVVVAEGVESVEEADVLVDLGCELLQGYLFAKPGAAFPSIHSHLKDKVRAG